MRMSMVILALLALVAGSAADEATVTPDALDKRIRELRAEARYAEALETAGQLLALRRSDADATPFEVADAEVLLTTLESILGLPPSAQSELSEADSLSIVLDSLINERRYDEAAAVVRRQLEIRRRLLGDEHPEVALDLHNLAFALWATGEYAAAEETYRDALAIRRRLLGPGHPVVAMNLCALGVTLRMMGDYATAEPTYREALALLRQSLGEESPEVCEALSDLAGILRIKGDYAAAEPLLREALAMRRRLLGAEHPDVGLDLNDLALLLHNRGDYAAAEPLYQKALGLFRELLGEEHIYVALVLNNLGGLSSDKGDPEAAERFFRDVLAMDRRLFGEEHVYVADDLGNLAGTLQDQGDYGAAESLWREALAMNRDFLGDEHPNIAAIFHNLAALLQRKGDYAAAESLYRESLDMNRKLLGETSPHVLKTMWGIANLFREQGAYASAEPILTEAARGYGAARVRAGTGMARATFMESPHRVLAATRLALGMTDAAWVASEEGLARTLADLLLAVEQRELTPSEEAYEDSLREALSNLERSLAAYEEAALHDTTAKARDRLEQCRSDLLAAEAEWSAFQRGIASKYPVSEGQALSLAHVQATLSTQAALIGWLDVGTGTGEYESWAYAIRSSGSVVWVPLRAPEGLSPDLSPFERAQRAIADLASSTSPAIAVNMRARELWAERIEPLLPALEGVEKLIVVPSGVMLGVPVEALVDNEGVFVGETYAVSYVPSATICTWLAERAGREVGSRMLLVGDPPYNPAHLVAMEREEDVVVASAELSLRAETLRSALAGNDDALAALPRLRGTRDEVAAVADLPEQSSLLLGAEATEQELVRLAESGELAEFRTIHIATHALVDDERPERSALVLSQVDLPDPLEAAMGGTRIYDGLVTATEILREWDLNADLVTLSACETGLGKKVMGEGYVGFAHAFLQAGARSLLVSLWKVEDKATSLLMRHFYENRLGKYEDVRHGRVGQRMPKAEALQEAKQWLRSYTDEYGEHPYEHPYFWSAFILIGEPT